MEGVLMEKKILDKIKLTRFSENELEKRAMNGLKGGASKCSCMGGGGASEYWCKAVPVSK